MKRQRHVWAVIFQNPYCSHLDLSIVRCSWNARAKRYRFWNVSSQTLFSFSKINAFLKFDDVSNTGLDSVLYFYFAAKTKKEVEIFVKGFKKGITYFAKSQKQITFNLLHDFLTKVERD